MAQFVVERTKRPDIVGMVVPSFRPRADVIELVDGRLAATCLAAESGSQRHELADVEGNPIALVPPRGLDGVEEEVFEREGLLSLECRGDPRGKHAQEPPRPVSGNAHRTDDDLDPPGRHG